MTWSTMYRIEKTASTSETSTAPPIAASRPSTGCRVIEATSAAEKAPNSS